MHSGVEAVVLQGEGAFGQVERPGERRALPGGTDQRGVEAVAPVRRGGGEIQRGVGIHGDEASARLEVAGDGRVHLLQFGAVAGVIQQIGGNHQVELGLAGDCARITCVVLDAEAVHGLLLAGQFDHAGRKIDAQQSCRPALSQQS